MTWGKILKNKETILMIMGSEIVASFNLKWFQWFQWNLKLIYLIWLSVKSSFFHNEVITAGTSWRDSVEQKDKLPTTQTWHKNMIYIIIIINVRFCKGGKYQMISPFVFVATYSFKMVVRPFPKTDCVCGGEGGKDAIYSLCSDIHLTYVTYGISDKKTHLQKHKQE